MGKKTQTQTQYLEEQASNLLELATNVGIVDNYLFCTTFNKYLLQLDLLKQLDNDFRQGTSLVSKEYVKGRENVVANPLIDRINKTVDSSSKTANLLFKLIANAKSLQKQEQELNKAQLLELEEDINNLNQKEFINKWRMSIASASTLLAKKSEEEFFL